MNGEFHEEFVEEPISVELPCRLCGAPAGVTCLDYVAMRQMNAAFDRIEEAFMTPEELSI